MPEQMRLAVLIGAFVGLRIAEVSAALRVGDVDFMRGVVARAIRWPEDKLKSASSYRTHVPIPQELALELSAAVARFCGPTVVANEEGERVGPWAIETGCASRTQAIQGTAGPVPVPRPAALLRLVAHREWRISQGRPAPTRVAIGDNDPQLLRAHGPRRRRVRPRCRWSGTGNTGGLAEQSPKSCGLDADWERIVNAKQQVRRLLNVRCRSTSRTRAGAGGSGSGRPRSCASTRPRSR